MNGERIPIFVASFVLMEYGTGAIMSVPAHDQRDFDFATSYSLPIRVVIQPGQQAESLQEAYTEAGVLVNSGSFSGIRSEEAKELIAAYIEEKGLGKRVINYRLRDWGISRQRYWGTPIPVVHCDICGIVPVPEKDLPVILPEDVKFTGTGGSPLSESESFLIYTLSFLRRKGKKGDRHDGYLRGFFLVLYRLLSGKGQYRFY